MELRARAAPQFDASLPYELGGRSFNETSTAVGLTYATVKHIVDNCAYVGEHSVAERAGARHRSPAAREAPRGCPQTRSRGVLPRSIADGHGEDCRAGGGGCSVDRARAPDRCSEPGVRAGRGPAVRPVLRRHLAERQRL